MGRTNGPSDSTVHRVWRAFGLQPHWMKTFKLSFDPLLVSIVGDIVGLYLAQQDKSLVLCVDPKAESQPLDRTQPLVPLRLGQVECGPHDYGWPGTSTLFAALKVQTGEVIGQRHQFDRARQFRKFLDTIEANVPPSLDVQLILDNSGTKKTALIRRWVLIRSLFHVHYT